MRAAATDRPPSPETMRADSDLDLTVGRELHDRQDRAVEAHHNEEDETDPRAVACGFARYEGQPDKYYDEDEGVGAVARCYECGTAVDFNDPEDAYYDEEAEAWFCAECS